MGGVDKVDCRVVLSVESLVDTEDVGVEELGESDDTDDDFVGNELGTSVVEETVGDSDIVDRIDEDTNGVEDVITVFELNGVDDVNVEVEESVCDLVDIVVEVSTLADDVTD